MVGSSNLSRSTFVGVVLLVGRQPSKLELAGSSPVTHSTPVRGALKIGPCLAERGGTGGASGLNFLLKQQHSLKYKGSVSGTALGASAEARPLCLAELLR